MSACSASAMSQVGCRLMVASMAKMSRPRPVVVCGASVFILAMKSATCRSEEDVVGAFAAGAPTAFSRSAESRSFPLRCCALDCVLRFSTMAAFSCGARGSQGQLEYRSILGSNCEPPQPLVNEVHSVAPVACRHRPTDRIGRCQGMRPPLSQFGERQDDLGFIHFPSDA